MVGNELVNVAEWCTMEETLEIIGIAERTLFRLLRKGKGPRKLDFDIPGGGRENRYLRSDVERIRDARNPPAVIAADSAIGPRPSMPPLSERVAASAPIDGVAIIVRAMEMVHASRRPVRRLAEMMTIEEAADYLKMSQGIIRRLIAAGSVRTFRSGRELKLFRADVDVIPPEAIMALPPAPKRLASARPRAAAPAPAPEISAESASFAATPSVSPAMNGLAASLAVG